MARELLPVPMQDQMGGDVYSGIARAAGLLWCGRERAVEGRRSDTVLVYCHPSSNFVGHYALEATAQLGYDAVGAVLRYAGNDTQVILENCVADLGSIIRYLREEEGYRRVVLVGNSGGGGLSAFYQSQAEKPTVTDAPGGGGTDLTTAELPPVDALVMLNAHAGRADLLQGWLDPAILDEDDPFRRDPKVDLFADRALPLDRGWVEAYRQAQRERMRRITAGVTARLAELGRRYGDAVPDLPFHLNGTCADPRFLDTTLDPSDREPGTLWGDAKSANLRPVTLGSFSTLRSWLSQWSVEHTHAHGPSCLEHVSVPVHVVYATGDKGCFPSMARELHEAARHRARRLTAVPGSGHYFEGPRHLLVDALRAVGDWLEEPTTVGS
ncbi:alpha/beta hydrolase [Streptomyces sp. NPDC088921]|uniref:alpha/beta hydrolase n=1 Tax=unclassified Streptomyces TaxID=2593676 RepID=UPI00341CAAE7